MSILRRVVILNDGRKAFLEYLRNLTSISLLLAFALFSALKLDFTRVDASNAHFTILTGALFISWVIAFTANLTLFYEACYFGKPSWIEAKVATIQGQRMPLVKGVVYFMQCAIKEKWVEIIEIMFTFLLAQIALVVVAYQAVKIASDM
ncbi:hypothetical protein [Chitinimonas taiwanensis]|uniref:hypothetical protein n=1 Tax=Chitinimonas taiwanensis TaxID=240412 RepID=UPI0035B2FD77